MEPRMLKRRRRRACDSSGRTSTSPVPSDCWMTILTMLLLRLAAADVVQAQFSYQYEVEKRVHERLQEYMSAPITVTSLVSSYRENDGFANGMKAADRDDYLKFGYTMGIKFDQKLYYGLEDGTFLGHDTAAGTYREPAESGYDINDPEQFVENEKHYRSCLDQNGTRLTCDMKAGGKYIACAGEAMNCSVIEPCDDEVTQECRSNHDDCFANTETRNEVVKYCRKYVILEAPDPEAGGRQLGYAPRMYFCISKKGLFTQTPGQVLTDANGTLGNCYYQDGETIVENNLIGDYAYCGGGNAVCDTTFQGAYRSRDYDPRWRSWYIAARAKQRRMWSEPYIFFSDQTLGITYAEPIYSEMEDGRTLFEGVVAVDYEFEEIKAFLITNYANGSIAVAICEEAVPSYMIGSSTGSPVAKKVLQEDETKPCPANLTKEEEADICTQVRIKISEYAQGTVESFTFMDVIVSRAYVMQQAAGFPRTEVLAVKGDDVLGSPAFVSQTQVFEDVGADLKWRIVIVGPTEMSDADTILVGNPLFGVIIAVGVLGLVVCAMMLVVFWRHRNERAIILSDWRFTCAFILGCSLLNAATISFVGPNTEQTCLMRMWMFHLLFAVTLSPLLVKTYRMKRLVGSRNFRRVMISHTMTAVYTLPIIVSQVVILTVFTYVDPNKPIELIDTDAGVQRIICRHETNAFAIVQIVFEAGLLLMGCFLAYQTRNLTGDYGEAKQLIFAMYNVAAIFTVVAVISNVIDNGQAAERILYALGIFWGTVFSSLAFVLPRLMQLGADAAKLQISFGTTTAAFERKETERVGSSRENSGAFASTTQRFVSSAPLYLASSTESETKQTTTTSIVNNAGGSVTSTTTQKSVVFAPAEVTTTKIVAAEEEEERRPPSPVG